MKHTANHTFMLDKAPLVTVHDSGILSIHRRDICCETNTHDGFTLLIKTKEVEVLLAKLKLALTNMLNRKDE